MDTFDPFPALDSLQGFGTQSDELAALRRQAFEDGRAAGFEQGRFEGRSRGLVEGRNEAVAEITALRRSIDAAVDVLGRNTLGLSSDLADFALDIARAVLERELAVATDPGRDALIRAIDAAPGRGDLVARLHPDDVEVLGDIATLAPGRAVRVVADPSVVRGGCVLDAGSARVDAGIDTALERVRIALVGETAGSLEELS